jgi:hypothetical protein
VSFAFFYFCSSAAIKISNQEFEMNFSLQTTAPTYSLQYKNKAVKTSKRIELKQDTKSLLNDFTIVDTKTSTFDENWKPVWDSRN